ncbi:MAG TPA: IS701 family transposase [Anaerolineales bacterium]
MQKKPNGDIYDSKRWGLPAEAVGGLGDRLSHQWEQYRGFFKTKTRDSAKHAWTYLRGLLGMQMKRNYANIARQVIDPKEDGQDLQQFMSDSPWEAQAVIQKVQQEIAETAGLQQGGVLLLDESADEKSGEKSAGAGPQHNGRLGKIAMSQVGVFLAFYKDVVWTWVDGELFLQEHWFTHEMASERKRVGVPEKRRFATKIELGWRMIQRVQAHGLPFEAVACDALYGRSGWLRRQMDQAGILYMAEVPEDTHIYLTKPDFGVPPPTPGQVGRFHTRPKVLSGDLPVEARQLIDSPDTHFRRYAVRHTERGELADRFAMRRIWTIREGELAQEWLVIRYEDDHDYTYALSNAPLRTTLKYLAWLKCVRHFVERSNQDAKSEIGWDELQAQKYQAWEHHLALTIMATWFIAQTKYDWKIQYARDPHLAQQMELEVLPALSVTNVRALLQATMPLPQLTPEQATQLIVKHLVNRSRSTRSRHKTRRKKAGNI